MFKSIKSESMVSLTNHQALDGPALNFSYKNIESLDGYLLSFKSC